LDKDILFKALLNYVEPKIRLEEDRLNTLRSRKEAAGSSGREVKQLEKDMDRPGTVCLRAARFGPKCSPHAYHALIELEEASHTGYNQRHTTADEEGKLPGGVAMVREDSPSDRRWGDRAAGDEELDAFEHMRPLILKALQSPLSEKEFASSSIYCLVRQGSGLKGRLRKEKSRRPKGQFAMSSVMIGR